MKIITKIIQILTFILLLKSATTKKQLLHVQNFYHGTYLIAASKSIAKNQNKLQHELSKFVHIPKSNVKHQYVNFDLYPKNQNQVNIEKSRDKSILTKLKNYCFDQEEVLGRKQKLEKFKTGKCSPVMIVPGILGTSLILQIQCEKLKTYNNGTLFKQCGWQTCSFLGVHTPDEEYLLWVGLDLSLKVTSGFSKCFGNLFGLLYDPNNNSSNFENRYSQAAGLKSTWFGNDIASSPYSDCGTNSIRDLSGFVSPLSVIGTQCALQGFGRLIDMLKVMGYEPGITMQPLPYDFRYGILASTTTQLVPSIINNLFYTTGKKVIVVSHSLGSLHTLEALAFFMSQQEKDEMIRHYIPITPPWMGTISAIRNLLYGDSSYFTKGFFQTGINKDSQMKFASTSGSSYDLFLRDAFHKFKDEDWMKEVVKRIEYEKQEKKAKIKDVENEDAQNGEEDYPMNWFPSKYQKCFPKFFKKNYFCETGFINFLQTPIFEIKGKKYYGNEEDIERLLQENLPQNKSNSALSLWAQTKIKGKTLNDMPAPGVNTSIIFTSAFETQVFYKYNKSSKQDEGDENTFIEPQEIRFTSGDVSVPSFSPLLFAAKWIYEKSNNNKSINVVEYCGKYQKKRKHYSTLPCECLENPFKNQLDCTHPCILNDKHLIAFILGILTNSLKGYEQEGLINAVNFSERELDVRSMECFNLQRNNWIRPKSFKKSQNSDNRE